MSRVAKEPINIGEASVTLDGQDLIIKGNKGVLNYKLNKRVLLSFQGSTIHLTPLNPKTDDALAGTARAQIANAIKGVVEGFKKVLQLIGVGYRAQVQGKNINLTLGYSHALSYPIPEGISVNTPSPTEIVIQGFDKQLVGQVAANIRHYRLPDPYKGKGVRYSDEKIKLKETKKK